MVGIFLKTYFIYNFSAFPFLRRGLVVINRISRLLEDITIHKALLQLCWKMRRRRRIHGGTDTQNLKFI